MKRKLNFSDLNSIKDFTHKHPKSDQKKVFTSTIFRDRRNYNIIKKFFNYTCQSCNYSLLSHSGQFIIQIAHIIPHSITRDNRLENLLVLCARCHQEFDYSKKRNRILSRIRRKFPGINYIDPFTF